MCVWCVCGVCGVCVCVWCVWCVVCVWTGYSADSDVLSDEPRVHGTEGESSFAFEAACVVELTVSAETYGWRHVTSVAPREVIRPFPHFSGCASPQSLGHPAHDTAAAGRCSGLHPLGVCVCACVSVHAYVCMCICVGDDREDSF